MGSCTWGTILKKSCGGHPSRCGPWNGRCRARTAFLDANDLTEPRFPGDLTDKLKLLAEFGELKFLFEHVSLTPQRYRDYQLFFAPTSDHNPTKPSHTPSPQSPAPAFRHAAPVDAVPPRRTETPEEFKERLQAYKARHPNRDFGRRRRR